MKTAQKLVLFGLVNLAISSSSFADYPVTTYSVPVPAALSKYSVFKVPTEVSPIDGNHLSYVIPAELTGRPDMMVDLTQTSTDGFDGDHGTARCTQQGGAKVCKIEYKNLNIDPSAVKATIMGEFSDPVEQQGRLNVAAIFAKEPIGILTIY